jgi:uncharacterized protein
LAKTINKRQSALILGPRQVGKTSLILDLLASEKNVLHFPLQDPGLRQEFERNPSLLISKVKGASGNPMVFIDEVQKVPELMDAVQLLIDENRGSFLLTGSSARKLRRRGANLLPGRVFTYRVDPLTWAECGWTKENRIEALASETNREHAKYSFEESLLFGMLPGVVTLGNDEERDRLLEAYATTYLEEEIRSEGLVRNMGAFSRFLAIAASESGTAPNFAKLSMEAGVSLPTIKTFYDILDETLVAERVEPYLKNARKRLLTTPRYYIFDLGVRNALARLPMVPESVQPNIGSLFEQAVILEIIRRLRIAGKRHKVCFWRTSAGAEVDCVIDTGTGAIPIEIKATRHPRLADLRGLRNFLEEYSAVAKEGFVVTLGTQPEKLAENITAIPWNCL